MTLKKKKIKDRITQPKRFYLLPKSRLLVSFTSFHPWVSNVLQHKCLLSFQIRIFVYRVQLTTTNRTLFCERLYRSFLQKKMYFLFVLNQCFSAGGSVVHHTLGNIWRHCHNCGAGEREEGGVLLASSGQKPGMYVQDNPQQKFIQSKMPVVPRHSKSV